MPLYDTIGAHYNRTRRADPFIASELYRLLQPSANGVYLDVGCGSGNYLQALCNKNLKFYGVDPSETMLAEARLKNTGATLVCGSAEALPFADNYFDGCIAVLTLHHWQNLRQGLYETQRVLKPGAKMVMFSFAPQQMLGYWLHHYFPEMIEKSRKQLPELKEMTELLIAAGFSETAFIPYFIQKDLCDHFLYSYKHQPWRYLDAGIRENISSFKICCSDEELKKGVAMLEADTKSGYVNTVMKNYENNLGDYLFMTATK